MDAWKEQLYAQYVSGGQIGESRIDSDQINATDFPYFLQLIQTYLPQDRSIQILDLACGYGALIHCLKCEGYKNVSGIDISAEQIANAHRLNIYEAKQEDIIPFLKNTSKQFDIIFMIDILEHLTKQEIFDCLAAARDALSPDGLLIVHVPNAVGLFNARVFYGDFTHETNFTSQSINQVFQACQFKEIKIYEDKPLRINLKGLIRWALWELLTIFPRTLLFAESGVSGVVLSQSMLVTAKPNH